MRESTVITWLLDELETFLSNTSLVSVQTPAQHVDVADAAEDHPYPFLALRKLAARPQTAGIGNGNLVVEGTTYDNNDELQSITYARHTDLVVEIVPVTDDDAALRDDLAEEIARHFDLYARTSGKPSSGFPTDMDPLEVEDATPSGRVDDFVRADGITVTVPYKYEHKDTDPAVAQTVNVDVDVGDEADTSNTSDADAYDETF